MIQAPADPRPTLGERELVAKMQNTSQLRPGSHAVHACSAEERCRRRAVPHPVELVQVALKLRNSSGKIRGLHIISGHLLAHTEPWVEIQLNKAPAVYGVDESPGLPFPMMERLWKLLMISTGAVRLIPS